MYSYPTLRSGFNIFFEKLIQLNLDGFSKAYTGLGCGSSSASKIVCMAYSGKIAFGYFSLSILLFCSFALPDDRIGSNRFSGWMWLVFTTMTCTSKSLRSSRNDILAPATACRAESNAVIPCRWGCPLDVPKLIRRPKKNIFKIYFKVFFIFFFISLMSGNKQYVDLRVSINYPF